METNHDFDVPISASILDQESLADQSELEDLVVADPTVLNFQEEQATSTLVINDQLDQTVKAGGVASDIERSQSLIPGSLDLGTTFEDTVFPRVNSYSHFGHMETVSLEVIDGTELEPKEESGETNYACYRAENENTVTDKTVVLPAVEETGVIQKANNEIGMLVSEKSSFTCDSVEEKEDGTTENQSKEDGQNLTSSVLDDVDKHSIQPEIIFQEEKSTDTLQQPSLSQYFSCSPPDGHVSRDPLGHNFFDTLNFSSEFSPMMKSVSDITILPGNEVFAGDVKGILTESQLALDAKGTEPVSFTIGGVEFGVPDEPEITKTNEVEEVLAKPEVNDKKHALSQFFVEDKSGGDGNGKAFFDALTSNGPDLVSPASSMNMSQSNCISDDLVCSGVPSKNKSSFSICTSSSPVMEEESFLSSLGGSDQCQHFDAWIPSELTRQALISMVTSPPGTYFLLKDQLTMPGIVIEEELGDPLKALLTEVDRKEVHTRFPLTADSVTQDENGLRQLIKANCYYAAINLTTRLLTGVGQGPGYIGHPSRHTPYSLQLWFTRMALFVKLRKFAFAEVEAEAFGDLDKPDLYYEFYSDTYRGRKGSMVPFTFRVLLAELPQYQGNHQVALDKLYKILGIVQKILNNLKEGKAEDGCMLELTDAQRKVSLEIWQQRECKLLYSIWNCVLAQRDYTMVVTLGRNLLEKDKPRERELCLAMGRIHLQMGDIKGAQEYFNKATSLKVEAGSKVEIEVEELTNRALLAVATNNYSDACNHYKQALDIQPNNPVLLNNMAVCLLYMGHLKESLTLLEGAIQSDPLHCLHEGLLFNTCTLYELESSHSMSKKYDMLGCVAQHVGDNFHISCLKIQLPHKC